MSTHKDKIDIAEDLYHGRLELNEAYDFLNKNQVLFGLYTASYLVKKYMPISIDYFANNLDFFAGKEVNLLVKLNCFGADKEDVILTIHKYMKLIICEILYARQETTLNIALNGSEQNYIRQIVWNLSLEANRYGANDVKNYIEENLDIITFNYDNTADILLQKYQGLEVKPYSEY